MSDYKTISDCMHLMKGNFIGTVIAQGDLSSGTAKDGRDWTKKNYVIEDATAKITLTAWGDNIGKVNVGCKYEFTSFWWKEYQQDIFLDFGKYGTVNMIATDKVEKSITPMGTVDQTLVAGGKWAKPNLSAIMAVPKFDDDGLIKNIEETATELYMINQVVRKQIKQFEVDPNGGMMWEMTKLIYNKYFKADFTKASQL